MLVLGWALQHPSIFEHLIGTWPLHWCVDKQRSQHKGLLHVAVAALLQGFLLQAGQYSIALQYDGSRPVWSHKHAQHSIHGLGCSLKGAGREGNST